MVIVYSTISSEKQAINLANSLLKRKIARCVNIFPTKSIYEWKGKIIKGREYVMIIKSSKSFELLRKEIEKIHPYEIPCIIELSKKMNKKYEGWLNGG